MRRGVGPGAGGQGEGRRGPPARFIKRKLDPGEDGLTRAPSPPPGNEDNNESPFLASNCDPLGAIRELTLANTSGGEFSKFGLSFGAHRLWEDEENNPNSAKVGQKRGQMHVGHDDVQHENREQGIRKAMHPSMVAWNIPSSSRQEESNFSPWDGVKLRIGSVFSAGGGLSPNDNSDNGLGGMTSSEGGGSDSGSDLDNIGKSGRNLEFETSFNKQYGYVQKMRGLAKMVSATSDITTDPPVLERSKNLEKFVTEEKGCKMSKEDAEKWLIGIQESESNLREMMRRNKDREATPAFQDYYRSVMNPVDRANIEGGWENEGACASPINMCGNSNAFDQFAPTESAKHYMSRNFRQFFDSDANDDNYYSKKDQDEQRRSERPFFSNTYEPSSYKDYHTYEEFLKSIRSPTFENWSEKPVVNKGESKDKLLLFADDHDQGNNKEWMSTTQNTTVNSQDGAQWVDNSAWTTPVDSSFRFT